VVKLKFKQWPAWITASPWRWLWLGLITLILQVIMFWGGFGPDTTTGVMPWNLLLLYYGVFFGFGALCYGQKDFEEKGGRYWIVCLVLAIPALLLGMDLLEARNAAVGQGYEEHRSEVWLYHVGSSLFQVLYAWLMIFGCIGLFRHFFSEGKKWVRYLSDSSYWLYIGHLSALLFLSGLVRLLDVPSFLKFIISLILATCVLLLMYHVYVRYTWIGTMLNGKRTREEELPHSGKKRWVVLLLFVFTWFAGFHRFYAGRYITGIMLPLVLILAVMGVKMGYPMVLTVAFWGLLLWAIHDFLSIVTGTYVDGEGKRIYNWR
jgi:TM2 domain-containing membrane protein YozV